MANSSKFGAKGIVGAVSAICLGLATSGTVQREAASLFGTTEFSGKLAAEFSALFGEKAVNQPKMSASTEQQSKLKQRQTCHSLREHF
jgi:hypothetical protein